VSLEYRVKWRREGGRLHIVHYQRRPAAERRVELLHGRIDPWEGRDPLDYDCCSGAECGCRGRTVEEARTEWRANYAGVPPFTVEPVIEAREVGEWRPSARTTTTEEVATT
jgi:hypothetical protein